MDRVAPIGGRVGRVVIRSKRTTGQALWGLHLANAVKRDLAGLEDHAAVERWLERVKQVLHVGVPELELPSPVGLPALVEEEEQVETTVEHPLCDVVEVDVDIESRTACVQVKATAGEFLVGDQIGDRRHPREAGEPGWGGERIAQATRRGGEAGSIRDLDLPSLVHGAELASQEPRLLERGERPRDLTGEVG